MNIILFIAILGRLLTAYGVVMLVPFITAVYCQEAAALAFGVVAMLTVAVGVLFRVLGRMEGKLGVRDEFAIVALAWVLTIVIGSVPVYLSGEVPSFVDALFEITSGLTATGSSVISDVEVLPNSILIWRSLTHWLGGMGIIVLFIVLLPKIGIGAVHLFQAEVTGPTTEKVMPRIKDTAISLWGIYVGLTLLNYILLNLAGMTHFDAINHAFSNMATGGFSTKNASISYYDSTMIEFIVISFMIISGVNFTLYINLLRTGKINVLNNTELKAYLFIIVSAALAVASDLIAQGGYSVLNALRFALFQVTAVITTTGFVAADYDVWPSLAKTFIFILMFFGGCAASTTGGIKVARLVLLFKMTLAQLKQAVHPRLVVNIVVQDKVIEPRILQGVARFFFLYMFTFVCGSLLMAATGLQPFEAMSTTIASLGNSGPAFGIAGPMTTYAVISPFGKVVLSVCMLLGRLELLTILVLLNPEFWKAKKHW